MKVLKDIKGYSGWESVLEVAIDKIYILLSVCALPALAASLSRIPLGGFQFSMLTHIFLAVSLAVIAIYRTKCKMTFKLYFLALMSGVIAIVGLYNWGLLGNGFLWSMMLVIFVTLCFGIKKGLWWALILAIYSAIIGANYIYGNLTTTFSADMYISSASGWATALFGAILPLVVTIIIVGTLYESAKNMLYKIDKQRIKITTLAERDPLTGLYNARVFHQLIAQAIERSKRHHSWIYLINLDLNGFKLINDTYGHHAGDELLKLVTKQLLEATRTVDTLCRVGGDEFLILIEYPERHPKSEIDELMKRIQKTVKEPLDYDGEKLTVSTSIGYVEFNAEETPELSDIDELLKRADQEMYNNKATQKEKAISQSNDNISSIDRVLKY